MRINSRNSILNLISFYLNNVCRYHLSLSPVLIKLPLVELMYGASVCNVVLDVHVKQDSAPGKGAFLSEIDKAQYRARAVILPGTLPVLKDTSGKLHYFQV